MQDLFFFTILFSVFILEVNLKLLKKKKEKVTDQMLFFFITVKQFSPGSFLKAPRKHVPALLRFLTPKRSVKGEFFMKGRHKLLTGCF